MNQHFIAIIKQIIANNGELILADPARLKPLFSELAKDEPKALRLAFGRCIEAGAYAALKNAPDAAVRTSYKIEIAQRVFAEYGLDKGLCLEALDALEGALFEKKAESAAEPTSALQKMPSGASVPAAEQAGTAAHNISKQKQELFDYYPKPRLNTGIAVIVFLAVMFIIGLFL